jgi:hypothetical protein
MGIYRAHQRGDSMITIKLPVVVDASMLKLAMETAVECGTELRIETFFRIRVSDSLSVDCDNEGEVRKYASHVAASPRSHLATNAEAHAAGDRAGMLASMAATDRAQAPPQAADAVDPHASK